MAGLLQTGNSMFRCTHGAGQSAFGHLPLTMEKDVLLFYKNLLGERDSRLSAHATPVPFKNLRTGAPNRPSGVSVN